MKIKWLVLVTFIVVILVGTASAAEMVKRVSQGAEQAQAVSNYVDNTATPKLLLGIMPQFTTKTGPQEFQIEIFVYNANDLANMDFQIETYIRPEFQKKVLDFGNLRATKIEKGSFLGNALFDSSIDPGAAGFYNANTKETTPGNFDFIRLSFASSEGISYSGPIATITYSVDLPSDSATIIPQIAPDTQQGTVLAEGWVRLLDASDSSGNPIDIQGLYSLYSILSWETPKKGDGDGDGLITGKDAIAALAIAVGKTPANSYAPSGEAYYSVYDMNNDGKVDSSDVREILKLSLQSSGNQQDVSQSSQTGTSTNQNGMTQENGQVRTSLNWRAGSTRTRIPNQNLQGGVGGKISSIPIQLP